jgi:hypothetical protein
LVMGTIIEEVIPKMNVPPSLSAAAAASQILSNALSSLKVLRERAQTSKDSDLKGRISDIYDTVLELKEAVMLVTDENKELKRKVEELERPAEKRVPRLRQVGACNYYFVGDEGPFCQPCHDRDDKLVPLSPLEDWNGGKRRDCLVCGAYFQEQPMRDDNPMSGWHGGRNSWMR